MGGILGDAGAQVAPENADPVLIAVPSKTLQSLAPFLMLFGAMGVAVSLMALADPRGASAGADAAPPAMVAVEPRTIIVLAAVVMVPVGIALVVGGAIAHKKARGTTVAIGSAGVRARLERADVTVTWDQIAAVWISVNSRRALTRNGWRTPVESWIWLSIGPAASAVPVRLTSLVYAERHDPSSTIVLADHALRRFAGPRYHGVRHQT